MATRHTSITALPIWSRGPVCQQCRALHTRLNNSVPQPTPFVPDTKTFLTLIGRDLLKQESKIPSWEALFSWSGAQLREAGVEPPRARRYLMWWRERYRRGIHGVGGDLKNVTDGVAELRVAAIGPVAENGKNQYTVINPLRENTEPESPQAIAAAADTDASGELATSEPTPKAEPMDKWRTGLRRIERTEMERYQDITTTGRKDLVKPAFPHMEHIKGDPRGALLRAKEGLWEQKRGVKVDGGERRQAEVRAKRRAAQRKAAAR